MAITDTTTQILPSARIWSAMATSSWAKRFIDDNSNIKNEINFFIIVAIAERRTVLNKILIGIQTLNNSQANS